MNKYEEQADVRCEHCTKVMRPTYKCGCQSDTKQGSDIPVNSSDLLYGVVEWVNDNPILDGMECFETKIKALESANARNNMRKPEGIGVTYTIIRLERVI